MDSIQFAPGYRQISRLGRTAAQDQGIRVLPQFLNLDIDSDVDIRFEPYSFGFQQLQTSANNPLLKLEIRDPVSQ
jgi:hypothetical protein